MSPAVERKGTVVGVHAGLARIRLEPAPGCAGCGSRGRCGSASGKPQIVEVSRADSPPPGANVTLTLPESSVALASLLGYLLPAVGLLLGSVAAACLFAGDLPAVLGAIAGLLAGLLGVRLVSNRFSRRFLAPGICLSSLPIGENA